MGAEKLDPIDDIAQTNESQERVPQAPTAFARIAWLGPGILWMVAAAGSGELLFTPRIGSLYGYALIWALCATVFLKWFINHEVGRFTVCTGRTILDGFSSLPGPKNWPIWVILLPQLFVAVATIAGLAGSAGSALALIFPGDVRLWMIVTVLSGAALVGFGQYKGIEKVAGFVALVLSVAAMIAAARVLENPSLLAQGLAPSLPNNADFAEIVPWVGFSLSGAAGFLWYSYWLHAKGYGAAGRSEKEKPVDPTDRERLKGWLKQLKFDNTLAVVGTLIITLAFLVLGTELLKPAGVVPQEEKIAETLGRLLGDIWGVAGFWGMIVGLFVALWQVTLSGQDGFSRMFADGSRFLARQFGAFEKTMENKRGKLLYLSVLVTVLPIALFLFVGKPVGLLKVAGAIEAAHIPFVSFLTLYLNHRELPRELRPSKLAFGVTVLAALFFAVFAVFYFKQVLA